MLFKLIRFRRKTAARKLPEDYRRSIFRTREEERVARSVLRLYPIVESLLISIGYTDGEFVLRGLLRVLAGYALLSTIRSWTL